MPRWWCASTPSKPRSSARWLSVCLCLPCIRQVRYADSRQFWQKRLEFELEQPTNAEVEPKHAERIRSVFRDIRTKSRVGAADDRDDITQHRIYVLGCVEVYGVG